MCSSPTSSPVSAFTLRYRMRAMLRSSSWLNDTLWRRTAWNSFTGIATRPNEIVPLQTGRAMVRVNHIHHDRKPPTSGDAPRGPRLDSRRGEDGAGHDVHPEAREDGEVEQAGGRHHRRVVPLTQRRLGDEDQHDGGDRAGQPHPAEHATPA